MYASLAYSYLLTLALAPLAAGFNLRIFIIFHDCTHGSFFKSARANAILGSICGYLVFTPFQQWRHSHLQHHATTGNLSRRAEGQAIVPMTLDKYKQTNGDVVTLTVKEYQRSAPRERLIYRIYRLFWLFFIVTPLFVFLVLQRFADAASDKRARRSIVGTNLVIAGVVLVMSLTIGLLPFLLVELPIIGIAATVGVWLFYIQHQFEDTYWEPQAGWDFKLAAMQGSSYYKLPIVLQWFTGNIGFHHIHHLSPRIPNYNLEKCYKSHRLFQDIKPLTLWASLRCIFLRLWDEDQQKLVSFKQLEALEQGQKY
jgi:omega-6 fatty acid desaturase (delta-12 desaturase)